MRCEMKKTVLSLDPDNVNPGLLAVFTSHGTKKNTCIPSTFTSQERFHNAGILIKHFKVFTL